MHVIHTVLAQPAPFFLPPDVNASTKVLGAAMTGLQRGAQLVGGDDIAGAAQGLGRVVDALRTPVSPASGPPAEHKRLISAWLTTRRLWPETAR